MTQRLSLFKPLSNGVRESDAWGQGAFGAPRGNRKHRGIDFRGAPGERVSCPCDGRVRRIGRCYANTPLYKLVEIDVGSAWVRTLYIDPAVEPGDQVFIGDELGTVQDIAARYPPEDLERRVLAQYFAAWGVTGFDDLTPQQYARLKMENHVHLDVRMVHAVLIGKGRDPTESTWIDPMLFF